MEVQFCITWGHTIFHVSQMSKNHKFLSCKGWKMKVYKPFWTFLALIHCYMPKHWTCHVPAFWENRITQSPRNLTHQVPGGLCGAEAQGFAKTGALPKYPQRNAAEDYLEGKKTTTKTKPTLKTQVHLNYDSQSGNMSGLRDVGEQWQSHEAQLSPEMLRGCCNTDPV